MRQETLEFKKVTTDTKSLEAYADLFELCFPKATHLDTKTLKWLYANNPSGEVIGFNAFQGDQLAAHYACIPTDIVLNRTRAKALLSLNTATHPSFQGRGLFKKLATKTFQLADEAGFSCIYGVANQSSTHGFVNSMGFQLVAPLQTKIGIKNLKADWNAIHQKTQFRRYWNEQLIKWRLSNPNNPKTQLIQSKSSQFFSVATGTPCISAQNPIYIESSSNLAPSKHITPFKLFMGLFPNDTVNYRAYFDLPKLLKPSPLNLIYLPLNTKIRQLDASKVTFGAQDFDAF